ncbi:MAG TPA: helix-turn-helix domain-containing protein [Vicinamibacterales bacterium]|nr:helix-turn-helix domain-containing protein [Vicinamibacterales bacterium]
MNPASPLAPSDTSNRQPGGSVLIDQACELLGLSKRKVYYLIREGRLETIRTRCHSQRVLLTSIEAFLAAEPERRAPKGATAGAPLAPSRPVIAW